MKEFTMAEFGVFLGIIGSVITSLILTLQKSRCKTIRCCGMECERKVAEPTTTPETPTPKTPMRNESA